MTAIAPGLKEMGNTTAGRWPAHLHLQLDRTARGTRLVSKSHQGPLYVQRPFYPEGDDLAHVYLLHPPGGLVSGDRLDIQVNLSERACALLTTPGAGRVYCSRHDRAWQWQCNRFSVAAGASLEWLPLENIIYPNARVRLQTQIELQRESRVIAWEVTSLGLPAAGKGIEQAEVDQRLSIVQEGRPVFIERLQLSPQWLALYRARVGLQGHAINGLLVAGPFAPDKRETLLQWIEQSNQALQRQQDCLAALTLNGDYVVGRYLGGCSEQGRQWCENWWKVLRPWLLKRFASPPRIWLT